MLENLAFHNQRYSARIDDKMTNILCQDVGRDAKMSYCHKPTCGRLPSLVGRSVCQPMFPPIPGLLPTACARAGPCIFKGPVHAANVSLHLSQPAMDYLEGHSSFSP